MIYPTTVALQEVVIFTYRAPVFDLPRRGLAGFNLPTAGGRPPHWNLSGGSALTPRQVPVGRSSSCSGEGVKPPAPPQQLDKTWGTKLFC